MNAPASLSARLPMPASARFASITPQQWQVLADAIFPGARSPESIILAVNYCQARGLDVFRRPVHIVPVWNKFLGREVETVWQGINEIQVTAARTKEWAGMDAPEWGPDVTETFRATTRKGQRIEAAVTFPAWCQLTVYRLVGGARCAFTEVVYWREAYGRQQGTDVPNPMWCQRPRGQLHKVAKAAVLRAAFPEECSDYAAEEMEGRTVDAPGIEGRAEPGTVPAPPAEGRRPTALGRAPPSDPTPASDGHDPATGEVASDGTSAELPEPEPAPAGEPEPPEAALEPRARTVRLWSVDGRVLEEFERISAYLEAFEKAWRDERALLTHEANVRTLEQIRERTQAGALRDLVEEWLAGLGRDLAALEGDG